MAPNALQGASLKKHRGANTVPIVNGKALDFKNRCFHFITFQSRRSFSKRVLRNPSLSLESQERSQCCGASALSQARFLPWYRDVSNRNNSFWEELPIKSIFFIDSPPASIFLSPHRQGFSMLPLRNAPNPSADHRQRLSIRNTDR